MGTPRSKVERVFYRNGVLREEDLISGKRRHGPHRTWHPNGRLASEAILRARPASWPLPPVEPRGKLLGSYEVKDGTGIQCEWFENGRLQLEASTVAGKFTGRIRVWLRGRHAGFRTIRD